MDRHTFKQLVTFASIKSETDARMRDHLLEMALSDAGDPVARERVVEAIQGVTMRHRVTSPETSRAMAEVLRRHVDNPEVLKVALMLPGPLPASAKAAPADPAYFDAIVEILPRIPSAENRARAIRQLAKLDTVQALRVLAEVDPKMRSVPMEEYGESLEPINEYLRPSTNQTGQGLGDLDSAEEILTGTASEPELSVPLRRWAFRASLRVMMVRSKRDTDYPYADRAASLIRIAAADPDPMVRQWAADPKP
jgi:hypothetical protein